MEIRIVLPVAVPCTWALSCGLGASDTSRRGRPSAVAIGNRRRHHVRIMRACTSGVSAVDHTFDRGELKISDQLEQEVGELILGKSVPGRGREKEALVGIPRAVCFMHTFRIISHQMSRADGGLCATDLLVALHHATHILLDALFFVGRTLVIELLTAH